MELRDELRSHNRAERNRFNRPQKNTKPMNSQNHLNRFVRCGRLIAALSAGLVLDFRRAGATGRGQRVDSRYLLIFDTSSAMKKRLPSTQYAVERLFLSMMNGQLEPGDSIGVWAFDRKLRAGDFPLQHWMPQNAAMIASDVTNFVKRQSYARSTHFDVVAPDVTGLVRNSERLTVLIFCDGGGEIEGTPYDDTINAIFKQHQSELERLARRSLWFCDHSLANSSASRSIPRPWGSISPDFHPCPCRRSRSLPSNPIHRLFRRQPQPLKSRRW